MKLPPLFSLQKIGIYSIRGVIGGATIGAKTGGSRVGGPKLCVLGSMVTGDRDTMFTQVRALSMEVISYFLLDYLG